DHTFCNILREELWNDSAVEVAAYSISHPLTGIPKFIVETNSKKTAKKALKNAVTRLKRKNTSLAKKIKKIK
ncbi:DNA-directed RNA polymerase subunit L, partial [Candidatus Woesearchaeota archaeon]|nr:DNA-directed RNA polymerase subunit L [Candidatus Woesearchaeota archaeon]